MRCCGGDGSQPTVARVAVKTAPCTRRGGVDPLPSVHVAVPRVAVKTPPPLYEYVLYELKTCS